MPQLPPPTTTSPPRAKKAPAKKAVPAAHHHGQSVAQVIAEVANTMGVPPAVALALGMYESGLDPRKPGDKENGQYTSFGIYQLHQGGELGSHDANWAYNVRNNATTALSELATIHAQHPGWDWGRVAAAAQRPADPVAEAAAVNGYIADYHNSGTPNAVRYFTSQSAAAGQSAGGGGTSASANSTPGDYLNNNVASQYGYLSAYLNDAEIGPILRQAAAGQWSQDRLMSALEKTNWWQKTSQTSREMQALQRTDPATYQQQWAQQRQQIGALATSMGLPIPNQRLNQLATTSLFSGWTPAQIQQAVGAEFHYDPNAKYMGAAGADVQKFKAMAGDYLVPLDPHTIGQWTRQALQGKITPDDFSGYLSEQAKTLFPWMAKAIDKGISPTQYLQPYQSAAAQTLELDPSSINLGDAKWRRLFETTDPKTGDRTERGLADAMTMMKTDPIYNFDSTQGAQQQAASLAQQIGQSFGFTAA